MVYETLKRSLEPIGLYREDAEVSDRELQVFAEEIERLYTELDGMFRERFIGTAENVGLRVYEELFGPSREGESVQKRRELLLLRMNLGESDFTPAGIRRALDSLGLEYQISEFPALGRLNITATADYSKAEQAFILREIGKIIPAHLEFQMTFNTLTWADIDALELSFSQSDQNDLTWQELDERTPSES